MRKIMIFLTLLMLFAGTVTAQVSRISGYVYDKEDGEPLAGASVKVDGTNLAVATDENGRFVLNGLNPAHQQVTVSFIGYQPQTVQAGADMKVYLSTHALKMDEVIVVAFGKQKRESFTGSASVVGAADIQRQQVNNPIEALNGRVPGMLMTDNNSMDVSSTPVIRVRGISSINASNSPLIVVDGLPFNGYMNDINPADIENITVLKDAASNALYGARGANGVILVTTKNAQRGTTKVTLDAKWGVNSDGRVMYDIIDNPGEYYEAHYMAMRNYYQYRQGMSESAAHVAANNVLGETSKTGGLGYLVYSVPEGQFLIGSNGRLNPAATLGNRVAYNNQVYTLYPDNWYKEGTRDGFRQEYNINISGGNDKFSMMGSLGYLDNEGITYGMNLRRFTSRLKMSYQAYPWLRVGANAGYTNSRSNGMNYVFSTQYTVAPIYPLYIRDANGKIMTGNHGRLYDYGYMDMGVIRPVEVEGNSIQDDVLNKYFNNSNAFNIQGYATIDFLKHFHFTVNGSVYVTEQRSTTATNPYFGWNVNSGGYSTIQHSRTTDTNTQQLLNYNQTFGLHTIDALLGHEYSRNTVHDLYGTKSNLADYSWNTELNGAIINNDLGSYASLYNVEGFFGRAQYDYDNRYFLSGSYRRDGSSRFHPKHRWGSFWSLGAAWIISKEEWFPKTWAVNMLKYKISYGEQGNDGIGSYRYVDTYSITNSNNEVAYTFKAKGNPNITWETVGNFNTGFEFELFNSRLIGGIDYYWRKTSDMLMLLSTPYEIGYSSYYDNVGDMTNTGVEMDLSADLIASKKFRWNVALNLAYQVNRITYIPAAKSNMVIDGHHGYTDGSYFYGEGLSMYTQYVKKYAGVSEDGHAMYYKTDKSTGELVATEKFSEADYYLYSNPLPKVFGGFSTTFSLYGIDLSAQFNYSIGGKKFDNAYRSLMSNPQSGSTGSGYHRDLFKGWTPENPTSDIPMFAYNDQYSAVVSDRFIEDASFLTLRNLTLGYTFDRSVVQRLRMAKLRLFATCENVAYWTKRKGFDPRGSLYTGSFGGNAPIRTISAGLQVQF